jgi:polyhydroxybutyrate depolymerase
MVSAVLYLLIAVLAAEPLGPGDFRRSLTVDGTTRSYLMHVPPRYEAPRPTPLVLSLHGACSDATMQIHFTGLNKKADDAGFIVVYPNGTGAGPVLFWNAGLARFEAAKKMPDDVAFISHVLDDVASVVNVDPKRVYATGMSNGAMMCYRLAAELSSRIAAIAPVGGTMAIDKAQPQRPVSVIHFHGTADTTVLYRGLDDGASRLIKYQAVDDTIRTWVALNGCPAEPAVHKFPDRAHDGTSVTQKTYGPGRDGAEVVLIMIEGGGHTWPGFSPLVTFLGKSTRQISANDLLWEFFQRHPRN